MFSQKCIELDLLLPTKSSEPGLPAERLLREYRLECELAEPLAHFSSEAVRQLCLQERPEIPKTCFEAIVAQQVYLFRL